ncbi:MAG: DUF1272 domain-containing protein [Blastocatellia bacterium]|nr:DUF1272 domain-containing protein [Blastocatellia bacterium]
MALDMRNFCGKCHSPLEMDSDAFICSFECTFCANCTDEMKMVCPNCGGELVRRPKRNK